MLERIAPFFTTLSKALREDATDDNTHWDTLLDHPRELDAYESEARASAENVTLIVGAPVFFHDSLKDDQAQA